MHVQWTARLKAAVRVATALTLAAVGAAVSPATSAAVGRTYPLQVDPVLGAAKLTASDPDSSVDDFLGRSVATSSDGSIVVAGSPNAGGTGAAYVFVRPPSGWSDAHEVAKLTASDGHDYDHFGDSVAVSSDGSTIVVGADWAPANKPGEGPGAVYVFTSHDGWATFSQTAELNASDGVNYDALGASVGVSSNGATVVAGAPGADGQTGAAYVFTTANEWVSHSQAKLTAPGGALLGGSVAIDSDGASVAVGAPGTKVGANAQQGAAYVFLPTNGSWVNNSNPWKLTTTNSGGVAGDEVGISIAMSGDGTKVIAGAPLADGHVGAAYVWVKPSIGGWQSETGAAKLSPSDATPGDWLGFSVAISSGSTAVAGAPYALGGKGGAYVFGERFVLGGLHWRSGPERARLSASDGAPADPLGSGGDGLGSAVAISGDGSGVFAGAPSNTFGHGAAYAFRRPAATSVACQPASVAAGGTSSCTASVENIDAGGTTPTGTVSFTSDSAGTFSGDGACTLAPTVTTGVASCQISYTPTGVGSGMHKITGSYGADSAHAASDASTSIGVTAASTSATVSCQPAAVVIRDTTQCIVTVNDTMAGLMPSGSVRFASGSGGSFSDGGSCTLAGTALPAAASCQVGYTPTAVGSGTHAISASYGGDAAHADSQGAATIAVAPASTATTVACQPLSVSVGHGAVCSAIVTDTASGPGSMTPTGAVRFTTGTAGSFGAGGSCTLSPTAVAGVASCPLTYTPSIVGRGTHTITAGYGGDGNHAGSSGSALIAVSGSAAATGTGNGAAQAGAAPKVKVGPGKLTSINGYAAVRLSCPGGHKSCAGTLSIYTTNRGASRLLARERFQIMPGYNDLINVHLSARILRQLKRFRTLRVTLVARTLDGAGNSTTTMRSATLILRHKHHR